MGGNLCDPIARGTLSGGACQALAIARAVDFGGTV